MADKPITENSVPDLDDWGWDSFWNCQDWIDWHKIMKQKKGKPTADNNVMVWWNKQTTGASTLDCRSFNSAFRDYFGKEKLLDPMYGSVAWIKPIGAAVDVIGSASDIVSDAGDIGTSVAKVLKIVVPVAIVLGIGGAMWWGYNKFVKA